jgi:membrane-associated phospholipid phosphatase
MFDWSSILPPKRNDYAGSNLAYYFLILLGCMFTFRGCVHYFSADGGSGIIAGIPLETYPAGAVQVIINSFGVYGIGHLLEAAIVWLVIFRYRSLIPLVFAFVFCSQLLGVALIAVKPLPVVPPGQIAVYVMLPLTAVFFGLSIRKRAATSDAARVARNTAQETHA